MASKLECRTSNSPQQLDLFDYNAEQFQKMKRLDAAIDYINKVNGSETLVLGSQQYTNMTSRARTRPRDGQISSY